MTDQPATNLPPGEMLRIAMRHWVTGVAIVTSSFGEHAHGMTVNSFSSISLDPPLVTVTMAHNTRTFALVEQSGVYAVTILSRAQQPLAELFAGRLPEGGDRNRGDRMAGLDTFTMQTGAPLLTGGAAFLDCRVVSTYPMIHSTLLIAEVVEARIAPQDLPPLLYYHRAFTGLGEA